MVQKAFAGWWAIVRGLCGALLVFAGSPTAAQVPCLLSCSGQGGCEVKAKSGKTLSLRRETFTLHPACDELNVAAGSVVVRYRHGGKWWGPPTVPSQLRDVFERYKPDACSVPSPSCLQARMSEKASSAAGHGVDSRVASMGGRGQPCALGLPCGAVLAPTAEWTFRLLDPTATGTLVFRLARGDPPDGMQREVQAVVSTGVVKADGGQFVPGSLYAYRLLAEDGTARAEGEFVVYSLRRAEQLKILAANRVTNLGMSEQAAWIDTLSAVELDWDLLQYFLRD